MNLEQYIKSLTDKYIFLWENFGDYRKEDIIILDFNKLNNKFHFFNAAMEDLKEDGVIFIVGGLSLIYQLVKERYPVLIFEEDRNISVVLPYKQEHRHIDHSMIPKMKDENYWAYLELWNKQGNRNIIASTKLISHILWNRFNPSSIRFFN